MDENQKDAFLKASKEEYYSRPDQRARQERDARELKLTRQEVKEKQKSRWNRNLQRLAGTPQMWHVLSFTGRFDPAFFAKIGEPKRQAGEQTEKQRLNNKLAAEARGEYRQAMRYARQREILREGGDPQPAALTRRQEALLVLYDNGTLLAEANRLTRISGNGRLRREDGSFVDTGGSTGGFTRTVLYCYKPPEVESFNIINLNDL